ncbi:hypothetical protein N7508_000573 [Penicillium antarcticum]|uniref:uncharacterized protein n=1 Tax=Penicillium antarcticum TaxID=416450 RepID=UPI0023A08B82|nr:uncharacterized protein N7508_000573 [Penicillium antarcticum]KAJ5320290.1 hypothetical protein N7508_000573 [Penicillium antarcticum]
MERGTYIKDYLFVDDLKWKTFSGVDLSKWLPDDALPAIFASDLIAGEKSIAWGNIEARKQIEEMLQLAMERNVRHWVEEMPMGDANQVISHLEYDLPGHR